jgi:hypothetical protein
MGLPYVLRDIPDHALDLSQALRDLRDCNTGWSAAVHELVEP